jgi:hypothetical protein
MRRRRADPIRLKNISQRYVIPMNIDTVVANYDRNVASGFLLGFFSS